MSMPNLLIAGGGTGGHIAPALAVGRRAGKSFDVSYACTPRPVDSTMYGSTSRPVHVMNPPRMDRGMKLLLPFTAVRSLLRASRLLRRNRIDAVLGTGGYSSFFAVAAAGLSGKPAAILETNAVSGRSNRFASRFCRVAFTGFSDGARGLRCPVRHTGTPVSDRFVLHDSNDAKRALRLPPDKPVILFLGGSQGAGAINDLACGMPEGFTVLLQCGERDMDRMTGMALARKNLTVEPFVEDLSLWYSAAELAVARAGGQTIAELSVFGLPAVLVPFPFAADDHQTANAAVAERAGAAFLRQQEGFSPGELSGMLLRLISNREELDRMGKAARDLFPSDPAGAIVENLRELLS
jgi:UDP-N-acetylglucosamine--N-acetylmuramyl-(pentapeptide) pyrophosphoryl-undecaprenol N-acetylglucosamine transferase